MGLVAWKMRTAGRTTPIPRDPDALGKWLPDARLATFTHREQSLTRVGRADAPLFVVVERTPGESARLPLQGLADTLFENMLRSIGMARHHTCQCVLASEPQADGETVATLANREHRASLVLLQAFDESLTPDACRLPNSATGRPGWCLPHPALLLAEPHRKQLAWQVLQALQRYLAAPGAE